MLDFDGDSSEQEDATKGATEEVAVKENGVPQFGMEVILNGGSTVMDDAVIPIRWKISDDALKAGVTKILIFDAPLDDNNIAIDNKVRPHIVKAIAGQTMMPVYREGKHRLVIFALTEKVDKKFSNWSFNLKFKKMKWQNIIDVSFINDMVMTGSVDGIKRRLPLSGLIENNWQDGCKFSWHLQAWFITEISVPKQFFSQKPEQGFKKLLWDFAHRWFSESEEPCSYRKRFYFALLLQWELMILGWVCLFVNNVFATLYILACKFFVWFFGWKIKSVSEYLKETWQAWNLNSYIKWNEYELKVYWKRLWLRYDESGKSVYKKHSPAFYTSLIIGVLGISKLVQIIIINWSQSLLFALGGTIAVICLLVIVIRILFKKQTQEEEENKEAEREAKKLARYQKYLSWQTSLIGSGKKLGDHVRDRDIFGDARKTGIPKIMLRAAFEITKRKVCKPYSQ